MQLSVGDTLVMKKTHPCGENRFLLLRVGMDLRLRCLKCGRELESPRSNIERHIKKVLPAEPKRSVCEENRHLTE